MHRSQLRPSAALSPTARAVLVAGSTRWTGTVPALAGELNRTEATVWRTIVSLANRGLLDTLRLPEGVSLRTTAKGRATIVRNPPGGNPRRATSPRRNTV